MDRRIFGIETEYGVTCAFEGQRKLSPDEVARYLFRKVVSWGRSSNVFLRNGARLYLDVGSHPEYATPECDDVRQLVVHDRAGERILEGLMVDAERRLHEEGIAGEVFLFKNNTDSAGNSYGCHENYLVSRHGEFGRLSDVLIPFLVTRQLIAGAGKVLQTPRGAVFCLSQRADHIWEGVSSATTRSRPIINTRDEPHADAEKYRRLHVIVGDSNMAEPTALLKVGSTDLVLRMIEAGVVMRDHTLENPIRAIREVSHDPTGRRRVRLANGREASALEIQQEYLDRAKDFVDAHGLHTDVVKRVLDLWERALRAIGSGDLGLVDREIDWVIKQRLVERYRAKHDLPLSSPRIARLDLAYHDIHRERGLYYLLAQRGPGRARHRRHRGVRGDRRAAADHAREAAGGLRPAGAGAPPRLHGRLGAPQAQRPGPAHRAVQGPVPCRRRTGRAADPEHVNGLRFQGRHPAAGHPGPGGPALLGAGPDARPLPELMRWAFPTDSGGHVTSQPQRQRPEIDFPDGPPPQDLQIVDEVVGEGTEAKAGMTVRAHYVGVAYSTGEEFDASWNRGAAARLPARRGAGHRRLGPGHPGDAGRRPAEADDSRPPGLRRPRRRRRDRPGETLIFVVDLVDAR